MPASQAGLAIQCPDCGRLNDVPNFSDLAALDQDGTFRLGDDPEIVDRDRLQKLRRVYSPTRIDHQGNEIDLRNTAEELEIALAGDLPRELGDRGDAARPKYDPETGELVRAIGIRQDEQVEIPTALPVMAYASLQTAGGRVTRPWLRLFEPTNAFVMLMVLLAYIGATIWQILFLPVAYLLTIPPYCINLFLPLICAHYVCVVNEIAIADADELPRPLRNASFTEDIFNPFLNFMVALILCYAPVLAIVHLNPPADDPFPYAAAFVLASSIFPAVLLTLATTGGFENLRPDRLLRVIRLGGVSYWLIVVGWMIVAVITLWYLIGASAVPVPAVRKLLLNKTVMGFAIGPMILIHIYLTHLCAWGLGLIYRRQHVNFGWAYQQHDRSALKDAAARRSRSHRNAGHLVTLPPPSRQTGTKNQKS